MPEPLHPKTLAWLRQTAAAGIAEPMVLCHLLERVEALEKRPIPGFVDLAAQPTPEAAPVATDAGGLAERVAHAIVTACDGNTEDWTPEARAAIREVAAWMRENGVGYNAIRWLEREADQ